MQIKRFTALLLAATLLAASSAISGAALEAEEGETEETPAAVELIGDADGNGVIEISDATFLQRYLAELTDDADEITETRFRMMDADGDGRVSVSDATYVQRFCAEFADHALVGKTVGEVYGKKQPTELTLNTHALKLGESESYELTVICDAELSDDDEGWAFSSDDPQIAEVDETGTVRARGSGVAVITCSYGELSDACTVTVCPQATSLRLNKTALTLGVGEQFDLDSYVNSGAAAYYRVYSSENAGIADVTASGGIVTARGEGVTSILCTLNNGVQAVCEVTVKPFAESIALNKTTLNIEVGQTFDFNSNVPTGYAAYYRKYYTEDEEIAPIEKSGGLMTAAKEGTTRIYCEIRGGVRAYCTVNVLPAFRSVMLEHLIAQLGNDNRSYVTYINAHSNLNVSRSFPWCAEFAWCMLDQFATKVNLKNPVPPRIHVSEIAMKAKEKGALKSAYSSGYVPKAGDLFTTSALKYPGEDGRDHIGYVEYVETDSSGKVTKVHTIEGNFAWETQDNFGTRVARSYWVPGVKNEYYSALCEYIDLETLFSVNK